MELERFTYEWETAKRAWETALAQQAQPEMPCEHHNIRQNHNATGLYCADCNTEQ